MMTDYESISEIFPEDGEAEEWLEPLAEWEIEVLERGLSVDLGDIGSRETFVANARVRVTEEDGETWTGFARLS